MEILTGDPAHVFMVFVYATMCMCAKMVLQREHLPFLPGTAVQTY